MLITETGNFTCLCTGICVDSCLTIVFEIIKFVSYSIASPPVNYKNLELVSSSVLCGYNTVTVGVKLMLEIYRLRIEA